MANRTSLCLCMIVRDEADVLEHCVRSCRELIDYWVICDTGSVDGTQDLIRRELDMVPGELHEQKWVDFGHNRTELLKIARGKADYLLIIDADMTLEARPGAFDHLSADAYLLRHAGMTEYHTKRLVRGELDWRYVGAVHEYILSDEERSCERLDGVALRSASVGAVRKGRWERDALSLERELDRDPADERAVFYLAQTYRDIGLETNDPDRLAVARDLYEQRTTMGGWNEEVYCAWHQLGLLSAGLDDWPKAADAFIRAWETRPSRLEAVHDLAAGLLERGLYRGAHQFTRLAEGLQPVPVPDDILFVSPWVYEWGLLFQYSISAYWCGEFDASIAACKRLLAAEDLPESHRAQTIRNAEHALREKTRHLPPALAKSRTWAHSGQPTRGSAAE